MNYWKIIAKPYKISNLFCKNQIIIISSSGRAFKFEHGNFKFVDISSGEGNGIINCFHSYFGSLNTDKTHIINLGKFSRPTLSETISI